MEVEISRAVKKDVTMWEFLLKNFPDEILVEICKEFNIFESDSAVGRFIEAWKSEAYSRNSSSRSIKQAWLSESKTFRRNLANVSIVSRFMVLSYALIIFLIKHQNICFKSFDVCLQLSILLLYICISYFFKRSFQCF